MKHVIAAALLLFLSPLAARAASTDFEDLSPDAIFRSGDTIVSKDLSFEVVDFNEIGALIRVSRLGDIIGDGIGLVVATDLRLDFDVPVGTQRVSLSYVAWDPGSGIVVNGVASPLSVGFSALDGTTIADVAIAVRRDPPFEVHQDQGELTLIGPITSLVIGGSELGFDNIRVIVPEPTNLFLVFSCLSTLLLRRQRPHYLQRLK